MLRMKERMKRVTIKNPTIKELQAIMLLKLVSEHRINCKTSECGVQLLPLKDVYRDLIGRDLTPIERSQFI